MRLRNLLLLVLLSLTAIAARAQLTTYTDPQNGVTFQYPSVWVPYSNAPSYMGQSFGAGTLQPRASFTFTSDNNLYKKTLLLSLIFSYFAVQAADAEGCAKSIGDAIGDDSSPPKSVTIHGIQYQEFVGGEGAMSHQQKTQIDVTYRNKQCFVFERDFDTETFGVDDGKRKLTAAQTKALQHHLDAIMQSVVFSPLKP